MRVFDNPNYIPPSPPSPTSPLTPLDAYEMADLIQGTITETDPAIAAEIAERIVLNNISGNDFLDLSEKCLRELLSKENDQVFEELRELQKARIRVSPDVISSSSTRSLFSIFGANNVGNAAVVDHHNNDSGSSAILGTHIPGDLNDETTWDFGDENDLQTPLNATVAEAAVPQGDMNPPNYSFRPVAPVNPALENGPPLASASEQFIPTSHVHTATTLTSDGTAHIHSAEIHISEQPIPSEPNNADDASIYGLNESQLVINSLGSQSAGGLDAENNHLRNDSVLSSPILSSTRSSSPALSYVDAEDPDTGTHLSQIHLDDNVPVPHTSTLDPNILIEHDGPPIIFSPSTMATEPLTQDFLDGSQLERSPSHSLDPRAMVVSWQLLTTEDALNGRTYEAPQSLGSSREEPEDAIYEDDSPRCSISGSMDRHDSFTSNETHEAIESCQSSPQSSPSFSSSILPLEPSHDIDNSNEQYNADTEIFTLPIDIIPVTPPGSPIFEGLSQYMILGAVLGVNQDNVSTPFQRDIPTGEPERTLCPLSEAFRFGSPSSSGNGQSLRSAQQATNLPESPGPNVDVAIQSDSPFPHRDNPSNVQDSHLGRSTTPLEYIHSEIMRLVPTFFALRREMIDRTN